MRGFEIGVDVRTGNARFHIWFYSKYQGYFYQDIFLDMPNIQRNVWYTLVVRFQVVEAVREGNRVGELVRFDFSVLNPDGSVFYSGTYTYDARNRKGLWPGFYRPLFGIEGHSPEKRSAFHDEYVVSYRDPRFLRFQSPMPISVEIIDDNGTQEFTGSGTDFQVDVGKDILLGRGKPGTIKIYNDGSLCGSYQGVVVGSDVFRATISSTITPAGTQAVVSSIIPTTNVRAVNISASQLLHGRLILSQHQGSLSGYTAEIRLVGTQTSSPITISNGVIQSGATSIVPLRLDSQNYVLLSASGPSQLTLNILLELCPAPNDPRGVCIYYPLELRLIP